VITSILSGVIVLLGAAIVVRTLVEGTGGGFGLLVGALFIAAGGLRFYLQRRTSG
jgi:hypothetical protein